MPVLQSLDNSHAPGLCRPCKLLLHSHNEPGREHPSLSTDYHKRRRLKLNCEHEHHLNLPELRACEVCELCVLISILVFEDADSADKKNSPYRVQLINGRSRPHRYLKISFLTDHGKWIDKKNIIMCWEDMSGQNRPIQRSSEANLHADRMYTLFRSLGSSTSSKPTFELVTSWLRECINEHTTCNHLPALAKQLPTRLVEVKSADIHNGINARLCYGGSLPFDAVYVTLSHCWGSKDFLTLTSSNIAAWTESLPTKQLPQTFRDAMLITSRLGYKYIWIDSLCIIQDSEDDWMKEAARMSEVYQNSVFTISATASQKAADGCFRQRPPYLFRHAGDPERHIPPSFWSLAPRDLWDLGVESRRKLGLPRRAWALQERVLSRRVIHYSSLGVYWECDHVRRSELVPDNSTPRQFAGLMQQLSTGSYETPTAEWHRHWAGIIKDYSERQLTYPDRDKLAALSGVAKAFQYQLHDEAYVAGLWNDKEDLLRTLMWSAVRKTPKQERVIYRAPSWSWASLDIPVSIPLSCYGHDLVALVTIKDAQAAPLNSADPLGRVKSGTISVVGFCIPTILCSRNGRIQLHLVQEKTTESARRFWETYRPVAKMDHQEAAHAFSKKVYCVPWFSYDFMTRDRRPRHRISYMLLERADQNEPRLSVFRRAGTAESWNFPLAYKWDLIYYKAMTII
ncbi:Heterokaryon incompatibility [Macrophomina phaseolina MS6]|uniref:Heterokaryon incompatibility n=1 Tax=Macrophomina phaseolina (strain MS6) TaxID=1126212 RepID=K2SIY9_MACPH|nr:Heterokaryon incompatibility [Macrophomina phaseolina MS6]